MRVLTLDPGTKNTGWAYADISDKGVSKLQSGVILSRKGSTSYTRLFQMSQDIMTILKKAGKVDLIVHEAFAYGGGFFNAEMGILYGMLYSDLIRAGCKVVMGDIPPNSLKLVVCGKGKAKDSELFDKVSVLRDTSNPHERDALALILFVLEMKKDKSIYEKYSGRFGEVTDVQSD